MSNQTANQTTLAQVAQPRQEPDQRIDLFSARGFALACKLANAFASSDAVPAAFRSMTMKGKGDSAQWVENPAAIGNCIVAIETAQAVGMSITAVMQNADVIEGKLRWSDKFVIAAINASGRFTPLRFDVQNLGTIKAKYREKLGWNKAKNGFDFEDKEVQIENLKSIAWALPAGFAIPHNINTLDDAKRAGLPVIQGPAVSMKLAVEEGWYSKPGSKWQTEMRDLMLTYRSGRFFGNIHAPDIVMGMGQTKEEAIDMGTIDVQQQPNGQYAATLDSLREASAPAPAAQPEAETVDVHENAPESAAQPEPVAKSAEYENVAAQIFKALNLDALAEAADLIRDVPEEALRTELQAMYKRRKDELEAPAPEPGAPTARKRRTTSAAPE